MAITSSVRQGIAQISIDRPEKRNTLDKEHCENLEEELMLAENNQEVRSIVICGLPNVFCSGLDVRDLMDRPTALLTAFRSLIHTLDKLEKPVIAAVSGPAVAEGVTLLYHTDLVYCSEHSLFSMPAVALGLSPQCGVSLLALKNADYKLAAQKLLLSEPISPEEAVALGFVNNILPEDKLMAQVAASASRLANMPPLALRATKRLLKKAYLADLAAQEELENEVMKVLLGSDENREALLAFSENRKPNFALN